MTFPEWLADQRFSGDHRLDVVIQDAKLAVRCDEVFLAGKYVAPAEPRGAAQEFTWMLDAPDPRYAAGVAELRGLYEEAGGANA